MVKRKASNNSNSTRCLVKHDLEYIGQNAVDVIKSFLDIRSKLSFNKSSKSQIQHNDPDLEMLKSLFQTGLFQHSTIVKIPNKNFSQVVKTMISIFCGKQVWTNGEWTNGDGIWLKSIELKNPHMYISSVIDGECKSVNGKWLDNFQMILSSEDAENILEFDFDSTYWERICLEWSNIDEIVHAISTSFQGYPLRTRTYLEKEDTDGLGMDDDVLQWNIYNPRFSEADFREKYPNGC
jgi:hypothetical protein